MTDLLRYKKELTHYDLMVLRQGFLDLYYMAEQSRTKTSRMAHERIAAAWNRIREMDEPAIMIPTKFPARLTMPPSAAHIPAVRLPGQSGTTKQLSDSQLRAMASSGQTNNNVNFKAKMSNNPFPGQPGNR